MHNFIRGAMGLMTALASAPQANITLAIIYSILALLGISIFLFTFLIILRIIGSRRELSRERRKNEIRPLVYEQLTSDESPDEVVNTIIRLVSNIHRQDLKQVLLENARTLRGREMDILSVLFERLGFADEDIRNLQKSGMIRKAEAAFHLGTMRTEKAVPPLTSALGNRSKEVVFSCLNSLSKIGSPDAVKAVVDYLSANPDITTLRVAEVILERKQGFSPYLLEWLEKSREDALYLPLIINLVGAMKDDQAVPALLDHLSNPHPEVRAVTAEALGGIGDFTACDRLSGALDDKDPAVRASAAEAMGRIQCDGAIGKLADKLSDPYLEVKMNCAVALTQLGEDGRQALEERLSAEAEVDRSVAAEALQKDMPDKD